MTEREELVDKAACAIRAHALDFDPADELDYEKAAEAVLSIVIRHFSGKIYAAFEEEASWVDPVFRRKILVCLLARDDDD